MQASDPSALSAFIRRQSLKAGFSACGFSRARFLEEEAPRLESWLKAGYQGKMSYMEKHFDQRLDPRLLLDGCSTVISLLYHYDPPPRLMNSTSYRLARFAQGKDYHYVLKDKLETLAGAIASYIGNPFQYRVFTDSAPILERAWAVNSGLGYTGKNANLILPRKGSWFLIAEILCDLSLSYDHTAWTDLCGDCRRCLDACPTGAILPGGVIEARKCISYLTTELKGEIPGIFRGLTYPWVFGCDICQEVCPWNRYSTQDGGGWLEPDPRIPELKKKEWEEMSRETWNQIFRLSGIKRTGYDRFMRNIRFASLKE